MDVNGETLELPGAEVAEGARVELVPDRPSKRTVRTRLAVLHEDSDVIVVDKPAGLLTVPTEARERDTLWSRVLQYLQLRHGGRPYAGIVHRLDKDTSGAVVFARNRRALHALQDRFRSHDIDREYVALAGGAPPDSGTFDADLVRTRELRRTVARPGQEGRWAVTRFEVLERVRGAALVSIRPETGRTHQIRVHFSAAGYPILGDKVYRAGSGESPEPATRQMLHARRLGFVLPESPRVSVEAPIPEDFRRELESRRRGAPHTARRDEAGSVTPTRPKSDTPRHGPSAAAASPQPPSRGAKPNRTFRGAKGSAPFRGAKDSAPSRGAKGSAPLRGAKGSAPFRGAKGSAPFHGAKDSAPFHGAKGSAPFRGAKDSAPFRGAKGSAPFHGATKNDPSSGGKKNAPAGAGAFRSRDGKGTTRGR